MSKVYILSLLGITSYFIIGACSDLQKALEAGNTIMGKPLLWKHDPAIPNLWQGLMDSGDHAAVVHVAEYEIDAVEVSNKVIKLITPQELINAEGVYWQSGDFRLRFQAPSGELIPLRNIRDTDVAETGVVTLRLDSLTLSSVDVSVDLPCIALLPPLK